MQVEYEDRVWAITDPAIKLFGRDIPFASLSSSLSISTPSNCSQQDAQSEKPHFDDTDDRMELASNDLGSSSGSNDVYEEVSPTCSQKIVSRVLDVAVTPSLPIETIEVEDVQGLAALEKTPKRPDKPIPCPRCASMDTKFCYFNNYNVNQPRHFCRKCQRYWTAGGSLRNVPVGAGRRKHKYCSLHERHTVVPDDTMKVRSDPSEMATQIRCAVAFSSRVAAIPSSQLTLKQQTRLHFPGFDVCATPSVDNSYSTKSTVSTYGQASPKGMAATRVTMHKCAAMQNHGRFNDSQTIAPPDVKVEQEDNVPSDTMEHEPPIQSSISSVTDKQDDASTGGLVRVDNCASEYLASTHEVTPGLVSHEGENEASMSSDDYVKQVKNTGFSKYRGSWQLGSTIPWNNLANTGTIPTPDGGALHSPNLRPSNAPAPGGLASLPPWPLMYLPAMWAPTLDWASSWAAMQWGPAAAAATAMMQHPGLVSTVRKHQLESSHSDGCLWVPKTLRIADPVDAARSSIWTALGLGDGPASSPRGCARSIFQAKSEGKEINDEYTATPNRHSNPAAFSRSVMFNENS